MKEIIGVTDILCQALQKKSQDNFSAMEVVSATKETLSDFRNNGRNSFFAQARVFFEKHQIQICNNLDFNRLVRPIALSYLTLFGMVWVDIWVYVCYCVISI